MFDDRYEPSSKYTLIRHAFFCIYNLSQHIMLFFKGPQLVTHPHILVLMSQSIIKWQVFRLNFSRPLWIFTLYLAFGLGKI